MRITVIHNPNSGDPRHRHRTESLLALMRDAGHEPRYYRVGEDDWQASLQKPADVVVVAGGDGTVATVARCLSGRDIPLAIVPLGTANNVSKALGLTGVTIEMLIAGLAGGRRQPFDLGVARGPWGSWRFIEGIGVGLFANMLFSLEVTDNTHLDGVNEPQDKMTSALRMLDNHLERSRPRSIRATLDGQELSGDYLLLEAMNITHIGPNLPIAPGADPSDGFLDVVVLSNQEQEMFRHHLLDVLQGAPHPLELPVRRGAHLRLIWDGFETHVDDEVWPGRAAVRPDCPAVIDVAIERHAIEFLLPG